MMLCLDEPSGVVWGVKWLVSFTAFWTPTCPPFVWKVYNRLSRDGLFFSCVASVSSVGQMSLNSSEWVTLWWKGETMTPIVILLCGHLEKFVVRAYITHMTGYRFVTAIVESRIFGSHAVLLLALQRKRWRNDFIVSRIITNSCSFRRSSCDQRLVSKMRTQTFRKWIMPVNQKLLPKHNRKISVGQQKSVLQVWINRMSQNLNNGIPFWSKAVSSPVVLWVKPTLTLQQWKALK